MNHQTYQVSSCQSWNPHRAHQKQHPHQAVWSQLENRWSIWWPCSTARSEFPLHLLKRGTEQIWQTWLIFAVLKSYELICANQDYRKFKLALWCVKMRAVKIAHHFLMFLILPDKHLRNYININASYFHSVHGVKKHKELTWTLQQMKDNCNNWQRLNTWY